MATDRAAGAESYTLQDGPAGSLPLLFVHATRRRGARDVRFPCGRGGVTGSVQEVSVGGEKKRAFQAGRISFCAQGCAGAAVTPFLELRITIHDLRFRGRETKDE